MKTHFAFALTLMALTEVANAAPKFDDYPSRSIAGKPAKIRLQDAKSRKYATVLQEAARGKPNFAGHYVLASWGCGASCTMSAAIDSTTGSVSWVPFTVCCWEPTVEEPLEFKKNSSLLIVHGSRNEEGNGTHYYNFDGKKFILIDSPTS